MSQSADSLNWGSWRTISDNRCKAEEVQEGLLSFVGISQTHWICTICDHLNLAQLFEGLVIILHNHQCVLALLASFFSRDKFLLWQVFPVSSCFFFSLFFFLHTVELTLQDWIGSYKLCIPILSIPMQERPPPYAPNSNTPEKKQNWSLRHSSLSSSVP